MAEPRRGALLAFALLAAASSAAVTLWLLLLAPGAPVEPPRSVAMGALGVAAALLAARRRPLRLLGLGCAAAMAALSLLGLEGVGVYYLPLAMLLAVMGLAVARERG